MNRTFLNRWDHEEVLDQARTAGFRRETVIAWIGVGITLLSILGFSTEAIIHASGMMELHDWAGTGLLIITRVVVGLLMLSGLAYQLTRLGYLRRFLGRGSDDAAPGRDAGTLAPDGLTVLVPSFKEEVEVVRQTLISAALQPVPGLRVVLLIDDPPEPAHGVDAARLAATRRLVSTLQVRFRSISGRFHRAAQNCARRRMDRGGRRAREMRRLAAHHRLAARFIESFAGDDAAGDHNDRLFVERVLNAPARALRERAGELLALREPGSVDPVFEYRRLADIFSVDMTSFERKRYANLSHEPNKAMNLNSYLSIIGRSVREVETPDGRVLVDADGGSEAIDVPAHAFVIVLDADSLLLPDYAPRLLRFMMRPENRRVAVVQTPYASVPGAPTPIERIAGATTDVQLMAHQGSTLFSAGSWVGASALVRREAIEEIAIQEQERGHPIRVYIRDRTLNEDTDTTVDLIRRRWIVHNYPDRLAYSRTPPDFGALLIQRRRWATGGLIILPNLIRYVRERPSVSRLGEALLRAQYILSAPLGSIGIFALLVFPFHAEACLWAVPAFYIWLLAFARDLMHNGNRRADLLAAVALNTMLLPINLAGAAHSIRQAWTGRKLPFERTPKIGDRTGAPPGHVLAQLSLLCYTSLMTVVLCRAEQWGGALFYAFYAAAFGYALHSFIGWSAAAQDCMRAFRHHLADLRLGRSILPSGRFRLIAVPLLLSLIGLTAPAPGTAAPAGAQRKLAAVTFDDLPVLSVTPLDAEARRQITAALLDKVASYDVPAVGFVNEYELHGFRQQPGGTPDPNGVQLLAMWLDARLELGNHTYGHVDLDKIPLGAYEKNIIDGETVIGDLMRRRGRVLRYFRHPYLHTGRDETTRHRLEEFLAKRGYRVAPVTVDNDDWLFAAAYSRAAARGDLSMMERVGDAYLRHTEKAFDYSRRLSIELFGRETGEVVLLHANALNAEYFDDVAAMMQRRGYRFATLETVLHDPAYRSADTYTGEESLNWLARWAITRGIRTEDNVLDDFPEAPAFVKEAAGIDE